MIGIVLILIAIGIFIVILFNVGKSKNKYESDKFTNKKIELEETPSSSVHFSDDFKSAEPITIKDNGHIVTTILMSKEDTSIWVCPNCETENPSSSQKCCVCHCVMKRGRIEDVL